MLIRTFAALALGTLVTATAQAGTIQNGVWAPNACTDPGDAPHLSSKSPKAFNDSQKVLQDWQGKAKVFADCVNGEGKADQQAIITGANAAISKINDQIKAVSDEQAAAVEKLKKAQKQQQQQQQ
jgi:hypothetical protein